MKFNDHDFHCHTMLSACSGDPEQTPDAIVRHAEACGYSAVCLTDHLWDSAVPGASDWYKHQNVEHSQKKLPLPKSDTVRVCFGCEADFVGGTKFGLAPEHFDLFDFIAIPPNHFHMVGFVRPPEINTVEGITDLYMSRLEDLIKLDLPWEKIGIAHMNNCLTFHEGDFYSVFESLDESRLRRVFTFFAEHGSGIELNQACFREGWRDHEDAVLRLHRIAKDCGCKFYCGTDGHHIPALDYQPPFEQAIELLGLTEDDKYHIPQR